jgi:type IX secretion system PorP/SprF family membrane protein
MNLKKYCLIALTALFVQFGTAQEGLPVYSDYLTDNYYLLYPSMAGVANCGKVRLTARQQWFGDENAPSLQTLSVNSRIGDSPSGIGAIVFNDKNGFHSQVGAYVTYAHHIMFSRNTIDLNMLSFGLSVGMIQYKLDETEFFNEYPEFDPVITYGEPTATNFNIDAGFSYHLIDFYAHVAVRNILENDGININPNGISFNNLRTVLLSAGNVFHSLGSDWSYEPSLMYMYRDGTNESSIDVNMKVHREMDFGKLWGGLSYRRSFDGAETTDGSQKLQYFTPIVGVDYNNFVFAYTYSYQANSVVFNNGGFHQITLGYNFNCRREKFDCNCPSVN